MSIVNPNVWHKQASIFFTVFLACCSLFSHSSAAVVIEGTVKGIIDEEYTEGNAPKSSFFDLNLAGESFSADFWYEFDENNFTPTYSEDFFRGYDFGIANMGITVHVAGETFTPMAPSVYPLTHFRNTIDIYRGDLYSSFGLATSSIHSAVNPRTHNRWVDIALNSTVMAQFSGLDLIQNVSLESSGGPALGQLNLMDYGTIEGGRYPGDFYDFDGSVYGSINSLDIHVRTSTVDEPGAFGLLTLGLLLIGWRYRSYRSSQR